MSNDESKMMYGDRLVELRKAINLTTDAIAKQLCIAKSIVSDIETGNTYKIPKVFLRGYIVSYAELVHLPEAELHDYLQAVISNDNKVAFKDYSRAGKQKKNVKRLVLLGCFGFLLLVAAIGFFIWYDHEEAMQQTQAPQLTEKLDPNWNQS